VARVIAIANQKGGSGKTTTTRSLGAALAERGRRVLMVDLDPQASLSEGCHLQLHLLEHTTYQVLLGTARIADILVAIEPPGVVMHRRQLPGRRAAAVAACGD
jgi:chromosome partitioning protein